MEQRQKSKSKKGRNSKDAGDEYEGELNKAGKREGKGTCRFAFGDVYEGQWKAGSKSARTRTLLYRVLFLTVDQHSSPAHGRDGRKGDLQNGRW